MKRGSPIRFWAAGLLLCSALSGPAMLRASAQTGQSQTVELLEQARLLEGRGRMDLAKQKWQQVLLVDPGNVEGLAGLARVAKLEGRDDDAKAYLDRIRGANPFAPKIARNDRQAATKRFPMAKARRTAPKSKPPTADEIATQQAMRARTPEVQAAYNLLNSHHVHQAEAAFKAAIAKNPSDAQALAGMGQVRMEQANFGGAISFLEQAEQEGAHDPGVEKALLDARFYFTMQEGNAALHTNDLATAQYEFHSALQMHPSSAEATLGMGDTLLKGQHASAAIAVFDSYAKMRPEDVAGWRGLLMSYFGAEQYTDALALDGRVPPAVHGEAMRDPEYLRTLASVYSALGREAEAQRVLQIALDLPFPVSGRGAKADTQLQYAGLLLAAKRYEQASGLYRQMLAADTTNTEAWQVLIRTEHAVGQDASALQALGAMLPRNYQAAMQEPEFETLVASIHESQGQMDKAQQMLEAFLASQKALNKQPFVPAQLQLANIYMLRGNSQQAYALYREVLTANPERLDAWKGMLAAMHGTGHDREALVQVAQIPAAVRRSLERDAAYLQTVGSMYAALGHPREATSFLVRVQQIYAAQGMAAPPDVDIQSAWLLYGSGDDAALYPALMALGGRMDLTDDQRRKVQTIWAAWAVRRARQSTAEGNTKRALAILNAAAQAFPDNVDVTMALAGGYANAGLPKRAVAIFKALDLSSASAADYKAAVGAALMSNDLKDAETWLRFGLDQYPKDPELLSLGAKFETARGDPNRAAEYYRASLKAMPPPRPGEDLEREMARPMPARSSAEGVPDLATLLRTPDRTALPEDAPTPANM